MGITEARARELLYALHDAWNRRDVETLVAAYVEDMTFWANFGGADGGPLVITDKATFANHLQRWKDVEGLSVPYNCHLADGVGRASVEFYMRDTSTGLQHAASYRQKVWYRGEKILRLEEYHDAKALAAFISIMEEGRAEASS